MDLLSSEAVASEHADVRVLRDSRNTTRHDYLEGLWTRYEPYADLSFKDEFARSPHQRFWEMYLACVLMDVGMVLVPAAEWRTRKKGAPDLLLKTENHARIWVEATAVTGGSGQDALPDPDVLLHNGGSVRLTPHVVEKILLRYRNALETKTAKDQKYRIEGIIAEDEPYVVALNGGKLPWYWQDNPVIPRVVGAVLPAGNLIAFWDTQDADSRPLELGVEYRGSVAKKGGASVSTDLFLNPEYCFMSAIISSCINLFSDLPRTVSDFVFVHNPKARNPLPLGWLGIAREFSYETNAKEVVVSNNYGEVGRLVEHTH